MHIDKVKYTAQYENGVKVAQWIGLEASPGFEETADEVFKKTLDQVEKWSQLAGGNPIPGQQGPPGELPVINRAVERLLLLIDGAKSVDELNGYWEKATEAHLNVEWDKKHNELMAKEV